jgi:hypothetical protein
MRRSLRKVTNRNALYGDSVRLSVTWHNGDPEARETSIRQRL